MSNPRLSFRPLPRLCDRGNASEHIADDREHDRDRRFFRDQPQNQSYDRKKSAKIVKRFQFPIGVFVGKRCDKNQRRTQSGNKNRQRCPPHSRRKRRGGRDQRSDRPHKPRHPVWLGKPAQRFFDVKINSHKLNRRSQKNNILQHNNHCNKLSYKQSHRHR